jgi:hypothetical protein
MTKREGQGSEPPVITPARLENSAMREKGMGGEVKTSRPADDVDLRRLEGDGSQRWR